MADNLLPSILGSTAAVAGLSGSDEESSTVTTSVCVKVRKKPEAKMKTIWLSLGHFQEKKDFEAGVGLIYLQTYFSQLDSECDSFMCHWEYIIDIIYGVYNEILKEIIDRT